MTTWWSDPRAGRLSLLLLVRYYVLPYSLAQSALSKSQTIWSTAWSLPNQQLIIMCLEPAQSKPFSSASSLFSSNQQFMCFCVLFSTNHHYFLLSAAVEPARPTPTRPLFGSNSEQPLFFFCFFCLQPSQNFTNKKQKKHSHTHNVFIYTYRPAHQLAPSERGHDSAYARTHVR